MISRELEIVNELGLHARAAMKLVNTASRFKSSVKLEKESESADGKSILGVLLLAANRGTKLTIVADGEDEAEALAEIARLVASKFGESK